ncbi:PSD1 and planctomycete cytochrome C domain-containing protein [Gimesia aquarii]|uniref:Planctomycete cytochrome C n=1 Tax=Gimesia aquarii TaxID=2527964 RepID=A0A517W0T6_9PLAN|nr:PSD1 and planctomycete cytochrome C domain-containing protein [Gimesia aquarii]QDT98872.1 Planctomycete cytochrome C [Gimesia aquarii]
MRTVPKRIGLTILVCACVSGSVFAAKESKPENLTYEEHIRPIFRAHCFDCHGATEEIEGGLDLRLVRFLIKGGESGDAIVPGKPAESNLVARIASGEMPPGEARVPDNEIEIIKRWIAGGAKTSRPEPKTIGPGLGITPEERAYWAFQPIKQPQISEEISKHPTVLTPIDALLLEAMPEGLAFSPEAEKLTLIKRAYFDLLGLPPSPEEIQRALSNHSKDWYESLLDELLKSPHYGERWARHWLDIAGYSDSEGYTVKDDVRPWAWKYRDYIIKSLNAGKPFDQFLQEQLAGDELAGKREGDLTQRQIELLAATGFLRMAADGTGSGKNTPEARNQVIADTMKIVSSSLLGLSVACAQCHDHRYDPIPQTDYFALRAIFEPAFDWQKWQTPQQRRVSLYTAEDRAKAATIEEEVKKVAAVKNEKRTKYMAEALEIELKKYEQPLRDQLKAAYQTPVKKRSPEQVALLKKNPSVNISIGVLYQYLPKAAEELKNYDKQIAEIRKKKPIHEFLRVALEPANHLPETKLFHRGDHRQPKQTLTPAALTVVSPEGQRHQIPLNDNTLPTTGRRLAFARWLTSGKHPLVARVLVNRIWMHHFGRAIVGTPGEFGKLGASPTHPELLDWLAAEFMQQGWDLKKLHRTIMLSTAYRQAGAHDPSKESIDPENHYYWRKPILRLEAETLRDRMLTVSGVLNRKLYGAPVGIKENEFGQVVVSGEQLRRSLYIQARRSQPVGMLQTFDAPVMETNCERRSNSTVATQSLMLMNGGFILAQSDKLADRIAREAPELKPEQLAVLPKLSHTGNSPWSYGYTTLDEKNLNSAKFTALPHWTGSSWQGGAKLPDAKLGWVMLRAAGGHPARKYAAVKRWTAPVTGTLSVTGKLQHGTKNGNGVRGLILSSRSGLAGKWIAYNGVVETKVTTLAVQQGDHIDFITDCNGDVNSDSFSWNAQLSLTREKGPALKWDTVADFHGPEPVQKQSLPAQASYAFELALCRKPTPDELQLVVRFMENQLTYLQQNPGQTPKGVTSAKQTITNLCQALMSSNEFLYVD